jgi:hypothetical protein
MVFFKSAKLPGAKGRSNYYSSILLRDLCKAVTNLKTPRNSRLTFHSLGQMPTSEEPQCGPLRLFLNWFRRGKLREAFLIQKLSEDLWPGFQCQAHELYPAFDILGDIINQSCPTRLA